MNLFQRPSRGETVAPRTRKPNRFPAPVPIAPTAWEALLDAEEQAPPTELDHRFEWIDASTLENSDQWVRGDCKHLTPAPVCSVVTEQVIAYICPDCDSQLPADWQTR